MNIEQPIGKEDRNLRSEAARKVLLFCFGVVATAIEETYDGVSRLIESSAMAEQKGRKLLRARRDKSQAEALRVDDRANTHFEAVERRRTFPPGADIDALNEKITRLSRQIDEAIKP
jgi:polyhydroxyalkanoate synthesis regulator phasin